jgi:hypothetical protein
MFSYDGTLRPDVEAIRNHSWMTGKHIDIKEIRSDLVG